MCSNIGTPNNRYFPFGIDGKVVVLGVPILKHFRVLFVYFIFGSEFNAYQRESSKKSCKHHHNCFTVKILKIGTPEIITIIVLQLEQLNFTVQHGVQKMQTE